VEPCPPHPGLEVMRERIEWLNELLRPPSAPTPTPTPDDPERQGTNHAAR
jgi:hypothetical protein